MGIGAELSQLLACQVVNVFLLSSHQQLDEVKLQLLPKRVVMGH